MSNEAVAKGEAALLRQARDKFATIFGRNAVAAAAAPGRVNFIGEHIDYCEGYVLPVALPFITLVIGDYNSASSINIVSMLASGEELQTRFQVPTPGSPLKPGQPAWANYVKGVLANFPGVIKGFDAVIVSDVPMGAGLSSSASIEVAFFTFLEALTGTQVSPVQKAKLCQKAEHEFPGMPCGIMDQYISTMGRRDHALLIDCRSLESRQIPFELDDAVILVTNSNVKHQLTGSEYPQRRAQCQTAAEVLGFASLREASLEHLEEATVFCKINNMELLVKLQKDLVRYMNPYIGDVPLSQKRAIEKYIDQMRIENSIAMENVTLFLASPVNCYILIKRLTRDLEFAETILEQYTDYKRNALKSIFYYPNKGDLSYAVAHIVLLIYLYDITENEFANGIFVKNFRRNADMFTAVSLPMTSSDCYEIALYAYQIKQYMIAYGWFTETLRKHPLDCHDGGCLFTESELKRLQQLSLERVVSQQQRTRKLETETDSPEDTDSEEAENVLIDWPYYYFNKRCIKEIRPQARLHCQYQYGPHPFLRLARFKMEQMYLDPEIIRYYDVIGDEEIEVLKNTAQFEINATPQTFAGSSSVLNVQLRHVVKVKDDLTRVAAVLSQRSLDISGLTHTMADRIKVGYYGAAGYQRFHFDVARSTYKTKKEKRLVLNEREVIAQATLLYYLQQNGYQVLMLWRVCKKTMELKSKNCDKLVLMRAEHVIKEIQRTEEVAKILPKKDLKRVGQLLYDSHYSLSELMQVSCPELDELVDIIRTAPGVFGARMTGGGFGGCVVTLVLKREVEALKKKIVKEYKGTPTFFVCQPSDGARVVKLYV